MALNPMLVINTIAPSKGFDEPTHITLALEGPKRGCVYVYVTKDEAIALIEKLKQATK